MTNCPIQGVSKEGGWVPGNPSEKLPTLVLNVLHCTKRSPPGGDGGGGGLQKKVSTRMLNGCGRRCGGMRSSTWAWERFCGLFIQRVAHVPIVLWHPLFIIISIPFDIWLSKCSNAQLLSVRKLAKKCLVSELRILYISVSLPATRVSHTCHFARIQKRSHISHRCLLAYLSFSVGLSEGF